MSSSSEDEITYGMPTVKEMKQELTRKRSRVEYRLSEPSQLTFYTPQTTFTDLPVEKCECSGYFTPAEGPSMEENNSNNRNEEFLKALEDVIDNGPAELDTLDGILSNASHEGLDEDAIADVLVDTVNENSDVDASVVEVSSSESSIEDEVIVISDNDSDELGIENRLDEQFFANGIKTEQTENLSISINCDSEDDLDDSSLDSNDRDSEESIPSAVNVDSDILKAGNQLENSPNSSAISMDELDINCSNPKNESDSSEEPSEEISPFPLQNVASKLAELQEPIEPFFPRPDFLPSIPESTLNSNEEPQTTSYLNNTLDEMDLILKRGIKNDTTDNETDTTDNLPNETDTISDIPNETDTISDIPNETDRSSTIESLDGCIPKKKTQIPVFCHQKVNPTKYDYVTSPVAHYIKQNTPDKNQFKLPQKAVKTIKHTPRKPIISPYKNIVSPVGVYIKNTAASCLTQSGGSRNINHLKVSETAVSEARSTPNLDLPSLVYTPSERKIVTPMKDLPGTVEKIAGPLPYVKNHTAKLRINYQNDASSSMLNEDLTLMVSNDEVSFINTKPALM